MLRGLSADSFKEARRAAFKQALVDILGIRIDQVEILEVRDISRRRRILLQDGTSIADSRAQLEVKFQVIGLATDEAAENISDRITDAAEKGSSNEGSFVSALAKNGLTKVEVVNYTPPTIIIINPINVVVDTGGSSNMIVSVIGMFSVIDVII